MVHLWKSGRVMASAMAALVLMACSDASTADSGRGGSSLSTGGYAGQAGASAGSAGGAMAGRGGFAGESGDSGSEPEVGASDARGTDGRDANADAGWKDAGAGPLQIMPLGDSITYGSAGTNAGWRGPLYNLLKVATKKVIYVGSSVQATVTTSTDPLPAEQRHNEGHPSYNINEIDTNLDGLDATEFFKYGGAARDPNGGHWLDGIAGDANARPPLYPDIILMMVGTNNANDTDRTAVRNELHALITKITTLRPDAWLIVAQITPSSRPNNVSYNADVASEVKTFRDEGRHVSMVDMYTNFPPGGLSSDNVHPNDKGYVFMAHQWYDGVVAVTPNVAGP